ncbi:TonB family C-terminal domain-containing protein [Granulicella rosea]|uniref:TonB family C-terminal domain-containing protein n=1 Tax=Granulicella rosea TaxID=474952 RepID=A0A239KRY0_9BACT|nr:energy transducer TonB [Granulicella rosea]SNT20383.1 TonB family C-terminal domain-containing protein [Granulicella rosea]
MIVRALLAIALAAPVALAQDAAPPQPSQEKPTHPVGGIQAGKILHAVPPRYPAAAKAAGIGGTVVLKGIVEKDGTLDHLEVVSGPAELQQAAIDAASQWIYQPYLLNGQPTSVDTRLSINFNLGQKPADTAAAPGDGSTLSGSRTIRVSGGVLQGMSLTKVQPRYPAEAREAHVSGSVVLAVVIGKDGLIRKVEPISGPDMLRASAVESVRQWTYRPYLLNGEPIEVNSTVTVNYNFTGGPTPATGP